VKGAWLFFFSFFLMGVDDKTAGNPGLSYNDMFIIDVNIRT
jgi:hypothetical protein